MEYYCEIKARLLLVLADRLDRAGCEVDAERKRIEAARCIFDGAMTLATQGNYCEALRLLDSGEKILKRANLLGKGWGAIWLARTIFYTRLDEKRSAKNAWLMAFELEPNDADVVELGNRLGLKKAA